MVLTNHLARAIDSAGVQDTTGNDILHNVLSLLLNLSKLVFLMIFRVSQSSLNSCTASVTSIKPHGFGLWIFDRIFAQGWPESVWLLSRFSCFICHNPTVINRALFLAHPVHLQFYSGIVIQLSNLTKSSYLRQRSYVSIFSGPD